MSSPQQKTMVPEISSARSRIRWVFRITGALLWVVVFVVCYLLWDARRQTVDEHPKGTYPSPSKPVVFQPYKLPDFTLTDSHGRVVRKADLLGRPWVASFIFTRCTEECPRLTQQMKNLQTRLRGTDIRLVTITVDPRHDSQEVLRSYARNFGADEQRWIFLTGSEEAVYNLILQGFHLPVAQKTGKDRLAGREVSHSQSVLHVDARGFVVGKYNGTSETEMMALKRALSDSDASSKENVPLLPEFHPSNKQPQKRARPVRAARPRSGAAGDRKNLERGSAQGHRDG